jgi:arsenite methyltransferase
MKDLKPEEVRESVKKRYGEIARNSSDTGGCCSSSCCCSPTSSLDAANASRLLGYSAEQIGSAPAGSNLGLGCGNPLFLAALKTGETVLDLGSGPGFDSFLAAVQVGPSGRVIGVDMTPEMVSKAKEQAASGPYANIEFRLGQIEKLPVSDSSVDVIISNCVVNLSPNKKEVFREAFRVLKPGGRLAISDVIATMDLPEDFRNDAALHSSCIAGAETAVKLEAMLRESGFQEIKIEPKQESLVFISEWAPGRNVEDYVVSAAVRAVKPQ